MHRVYCKRRRNQRVEKNGELNTEEKAKRAWSEGAKKERFCVIERCTVYDAIKRRGKKVCEVDLASKIERKRETEREARQLGAPTDTHFCLSSFPLRAGSRRVTAGLHFWQTRGSSSLTKPWTTPP